MNWKFTDASGVAVYRTNADGSMDSMLTAALPPGVAPDPCDPPDWRTPAVADVRARRDKLLQVISFIQADYLTLGDQPNATLARNIKMGLKDLLVHPDVVAVLGNPSATYADFKTAVMTIYAELVANAPAEVKLEFKRYA